MAIPATIAGSCFFRTFLVDLLDVGSWVAITGRIKYNNDSNDNDQNDEDVFGFHGAAKVRFKFCSCSQT